MHAERRRAIGSVTVVGARLGADFRACQLIIGGGRRFIHVQECRHIGEKRRLGYSGHLRCIIALPLDQILLRGQLALWAVPPNTVNLVTECSITATYGTHGRLEVGEFSVALFEELEATDIHSRNLAVGCEPPARSPPPHDPPSVAHEQPSPT